MSEEPPTFRVLLWNLRELRNYVGSHDHPPPCNEAPCSFCFAYLGPLEETLGEAEALKEVYDALVAALRKASALHHQYGRGDHRRKLPDCDDDNCMRFTVALRAAREGT